MTSRPLIAALSLLALVSQPAVAADGASAGHTLAKDRCGGCHSVEKDGESPFPAAPPFRTLSRHYPLENLEEALAEGISAGHPDMPDTPWDPADIRSLITYLKKIQTQ